MSRLITLTHIFLQGSVRGLWWQHGRPARRRAHLGVINARPAVQDQQDENPEPVGHQRNQKAEKRQQFLVSTSH